jgi:DNA-binding MarR family transcriptional regulator
MSGAEKAPVERPQECVCLNLRMASRAVSAIFDDALRPVGLRTTQFSLLRAIERLGPVTFLTLAEKMVLDQTTLPRSLRLLEEEGLIRIETGVDRRERLASATAKGRAAIARALPHWRRAQERMREKFPARRLDALIAELGEMRRAVAE